MKNLLKFVFVTIALLFTIVSFSQKRVLEMSDLPEVVKDETITVKDEVWIEPIGSEIRQRAEINFWKNKVKKMHDVLTDKQNSKHNLDSLFHVIEVLEVERDSLNKRLETSVKSEVSTCTEKVAVLNSKIYSIRNQYFLLKDKHNKLQKRFIIVTGIAIIKGVIIILII